MTVDERRLAIDIVVPLYNEEQVVAEFHRQLMDVVTPLRREYDVRIYYVNDGSVDHTGAELAKLAADDAGVTILELSRNFGHQAALTAGLDRAEGDAAVTLDGDGQHPPELIADMVALYRAGYEVVLTQRVAADQPRFKRWTSTGFYRVLSAIGDTRITAGSADYRLVSRPVLEALREMREYHRFLRGMVAWAGYRTVVLPYAERARIGGQAKLLVARTGAAGGRRHVLVLADAAQAGAGRRSVLPGPGGGRGALRRQFLAHRTTAPAGTGLGLPDVHDADRGRRPHDFRRIGRHLRRLHLSRGEASPGLPPA